MDRNTRSPHLTHNVSSSIFGNNIVSETSKDRETSIITGSSSLGWSDNDTFFINTNDPRSLKTVDATKYETYITSDGDTPVLRITSKNKEIPTDKLMFRIHTEHVVTLTNQLQVRQNNPDTIDVQVQKTLPQMSSTRTKWFGYTVDKSQINYQNK